MNMSLLQQLDPMLHSSLHKKYQADDKEIIRARGMLGTLLLSIAVPLIGIIALVVLQLVTNHDFFQPLMILITLLILLVIQHIYFQSYGNLWLVARAYSVQYFFSMVLSLLYTGGLKSPAFILLLCAPLITYMTAGYRSALLMLGATLMFMCALALAHLSDYPFPNIVDPANFYYVMTLCSIFSLMVIALFLLFCEQLMQAFVHTNR